MNYQINFPNLNIFLEHVGKKFTVFGFDIAYYGVAVGLGMLMGILVACLIARWTDQNPDTYVDLSLYGIILGVIGARLYYVAFRWESYKDNPLTILNLRQGGLAIYGGVIAAVLTVLVFGAVKKISPALLLDTVGMGLLIGQIIGRWGNFFNREVFGGYTNNLFAMEIPVNAVSNPADITQQMMDHVVVRDGISFVSVHPTFLYESLWNLVIFIILLIYLKHKKFNGEIFLMYLAGYGLGRFWIEAIRTDQLFVPGTSIPVSQLLAGVTVVISVFLILANRSRVRRR